MRRILTHAVFIAAVLGIGLLIGSTTRPDAWYAALSKPVFNPPNWVFAPAWTALYILMAFAFYRILSLPRTPGRRIAITAFLVQIALNGLWSWAFFAAHSPLAGLIVIVALL